MSNISVGIKAIKYIRNYGHVDSKETLIALLQVAAVAVQSKPFGPPPTELMNYALELLELMQEAEEQIDAEMAKEEHARTAAREGRTGEPER